MPPREIDLRDWRDHLAAAEVSLLSLATEFRRSDDPHIVGMGEGLAIGAAEIHRILRVAA